MSSAREPFRRVELAVAEPLRLDREVLEQALRRGGFSIAFSVSNVAGLMDAIVRIHADVLLVDVGMAGASPDAWQTLVADVRLRDPSTQVLVFTAAAQAHSPRRIAGAAAMLDKLAVDTCGLLRTVEAVARGERPPALPNATAPLPAGLADRPAHEPITRRERQVLHLVAEGHDNAELAVRLGITLRTAKAHMAALYRKLGAENRVQLALLARRSRIAGRLAP